MIINFSGKSADTVWRKAARYFGNDQNTRIQPSRGGKTQELLHASFMIENSRQRWVVSRAPSINPAFALAEIVWIMNGSQDAVILNHWNPALPKFAGNTATYHGAYGFRLRKHFGIDQLSKAYLALKNSRDTRQVVLQIWDPKSDFPDDNGKPVSADIPCNICSVLKIRNNKLEWLQILRSNDLFRGVPYNFVQFTTLQEIIAGWIGIEPGAYNQISDSLHIYEKDKRHLLNQNFYKAEKNVDSLSKPKTKSESLFAEIFSRMQFMIKPGLSQNDFYDLAFLGLDEPAFQNMLFVIAADSARRKSWKSMPDEFMVNCTNPVYKQLWENWKRRKLKKIGSVCL